MKKVAILVIGAGLAVSSFFVAQAQTVTYTGTPTSIYSLAPTPVVVSATPVPGSGYLELNGLVVSSIPSAVANQSSSAEIIATMPISSANGTCVWYGMNASGVNGNSVSCPSSTSSTLGSTEISYDIYASSYAKVLSNDRASMSVTSIAPGDIVNVFGFYGSDGSIQASSVRDLSTGSRAENSAAVTTTSANTGSSVAVQSTVPPATLSASVGFSQALSAEVQALLNQIAKLGSIIQASSSL